MNIYDLEKQATPGPTVARETYDDGETGSAIEVGNKSWQLHNLPHGLDVDARLLAHCRNYFMPALRALREELLYLNKQNPGRATVLRGIIKELEDVQ